MTISGRRLEVQVTLGWWCVLDKSREWCEYNLGAAAFVSCALSLLIADRLQRRLDLWGEFWRFCGRPPSCIFIGQSSQRIIWVKRSTMRQINAANGRLTTHETTGYIQLYVARRNYIDDSAEDTRVRHDRLTAADFADFLMPPIV